MKKKIIIAGAGGIGRACGLILLRHFGDQIDLVLTDIDPVQCGQALSWIKSSGISPHLAVSTTTIPQISPKDWNLKGDILLDCTPGVYAAQFATIALHHKMHYANLTENVPATKKIYQIANDASTGFALQTGLAPGFINQLARKSIDGFQRKKSDHTIDSVKMRVGSLSQFASSPAYYAFIWNPMGVSTEYLNESEVVDKYKKMTVPSLSDRELIIINGVAYEADLTSGGAADLPDFYEDKVRKLNYKTLRYPGHFDYIDTLKTELGSSLSKESLLQRMLEDIPFHGQDRVLVYCSVSGTDEHSKKHELIHYKEISTVKYGGITLTAIQRATAGALAQSAILLLTDRYKGILTQSRYPLDEFLEGDIIREHFGNIVDNK